jgi:hypothetical protein
MFDSKRKKALQLSKLQSFILSQSDPVWIRTKDLLLRRHLKDNIKTFIFIKMKCVHVRCACLMCTGSKLNTLYTNQ